MPDIGKSAWYSYVIRQEALRSMYITVGAFLLLSIVSIIFYGAPFRVHAVDITALFIALLIPNLIAKNKENKKQIYIWLLGGVIGIFYWDVLSSFVIVKKEIFRWWYIIYPVGIAGIILIQAIIKYINQKLPYNL